MLKNISGLLCAILILEINAAYNRDETGDGNYRIQDRTPRENSEQGTTSIWDPENTKTAHHRSQEPTENVPELSHAEGIVQEVSAGEELNALLNCNAFTHVIYLLRKAETDLRSTVIRPTYSTENLPIDRARFQLGKARFWVQKLHLQMRRLYRSCLHLGAFKDFLKAHAHALQQENMLGLHSASYNERKMSNEEQRREDISGQRSQNRGNFGRVQSTQNSNRVLLSRGNVSIYNIQRNNLAYNVDRKNRGRLYASLGTELVKMVERNSVLDIAKILQKLVDLEERWRMKASQQTNSNEGFKTQIEIGGLLREVPPYFLSVALGPRILHNGLLEHISRSKKFLTLTRGLAPAMLRVGGSAANFLTFNDNAKQFARNGDNVSSLAKGDVISPDSALYLQRLQGTGSGDMVQSAGHSTNLTDSKETEIETLPRDQAMADEEVEDDCVFDFKWHSFYKTKPQNDSTYDVLKAILRASEVNSSSSNDSENAEMRDEPSKPDVETCDSYEGGKLENFTISGDDWSRLADFVSSVDMNMIFDLNQFYRTPEGNWDPTNAKLILHEAAARNDSVIWQLGNEPNAYSHHFGFELSPKRGARDFQKLNRELKKMFASPALIGPDITRPKHLELSLESGQEEEQDFCQKAEKFLKSFLRHLRVNLTALTWHHYYVNGRTATVDDFISAEVLDQLSWQIPIMADLRDTYASNTPIWLTETSSAWGGGADGLSNTYVAGFLWLDKLGMAAANAIDMVARQKLIYGSYALVDPDFNPYPDYWLSLLYKRLVGQRVLSIRLRMDAVQNSTKGFVRLYANCQRNFLKDYEPGNVVIYGMNTGNETATIKLNSMGPNQAIEQYLLEPANGMLKSREVLLNGELLEMTSDEELPEFSPLPLNHNRKFQIPPLRFGFWVIQNAAVANCT